MFHLTTHSTHFILPLYGVGYKTKTCGVFCKIKKRCCKKVLREKTVKYIKQGRKEMFYLMTHSTHFILSLYGVVYKTKTCGVLLQNEKR